MTKTALITGITGQDGSYLAELLLSKNYTVHGLCRRNINGFAHTNLEKVQNDIRVHYGDLTDSQNLYRLLDQIAPDEVYNLAAQSHVVVSIHAPEITANINALGTLRLLDSIRSLGANTHTKFYQASTSEMFGITPACPQNEHTSFVPASPYAIAKLFSHWLTVNYRASYNMFACSGILFNHESPRRGHLFVTRKITLALAQIAAGQNVVLELGNLDSLRDWGHAADYVRAMWMMMQYAEADDYVIATGRQTSVREFCSLAAAYFDIPLSWEGSGLNEVAKHARTGQVLVKIDPNFYRPVDVTNLKGDASKAARVLGWQPEWTLEQLVADMCQSDLNRCMES